MKKLLSLGVFIISIVLVSCTSNEKKAQNLIENHLKETLHDWSSYESVSFGSLDSTFTTLLDNPVYKEQFITYMAYKELVEEKLKEEKNYRDMHSDWAISMRRKLLSESQYYLDSVIYYEPLLAEAAKSFIPEFKGWEMRHSFRANNAGGNKVIGHYRYYFDKDITKIVDSEDASEKDKD